MGRKRDREAHSDDDDTSKKHTKKRTTTDGDQVSVKPQLLPSMIKNKDKRSAVYAKIKHDKKLEKKKIAKAREAAENRALELGEEVHLLCFIYDTDDDDDIDV